MPNQEARLLREQLDALESRIGRALEEVRPGVGTRVVGKVVDLGAKPTTAGKYVAVQRVEVGGPVVEGGPATVTPVAGDIFLVDTLGLYFVPKVDDYLLCSREESRWVASGAGLKPNPACSGCNKIPTVLTMDFFSGYATVTLSWQDTPASFGGKVALATYGGGSGDTAYAMPAMAWFGPTTAFIANAGTPGAYPSSSTPWIAFQNCRCLLVQVVDVSRSPTYVAGDPAFTADYLFAKYAYLPGGGGGKVPGCENTCNPFELRDWYYQGLDGFGTTLRIGCGLYDLTGDTAGELVPLDGTGSAGQLGDVIL